MFGRFTGSRRVAVVLLLLALGTAGAYASTSAIAINGGNAVQAGYGEGAVSGFNVSSIHYALNGTNPQNIDSVTFSLSPSPTAGTTIEAGVGGAWYACPSSANPTCDTTVGSQLTVSAAQSSNLRVVAAQ